MGPVLKAATRAPALEEVSITPRQLAKKLQSLWRRIQDLHLQAGPVLDLLTTDDASNRLALELAIHDLLALSARIATLGTYIETSRPTRRKSRKS